MHNRQIVIIQPKQPLLTVPESLTTATGQTRDRGAIGERMQTLHYPQYSAGCSTKEETYEFYCIAA